VSFIMSKQSFGLVILPRLFGLAWEWEKRKKVSGKEVKYFILF
jgi:hypothetical protein